MIKEQDLRDAIAECQGERNPNANTCIKLAAYYTILNHMNPVETHQYSFSEPAKAVKWNSGSEFSEAIRGADTDAVLEVMDELMDVVHGLIPKLYNATIEKLKEL